SQKSTFDMVVMRAGNNNCPGRATPAGTYTAAAPHTDSGDTTGANDTVSCSSCFYCYYGGTVGPDHIYSFTLTARGANPQIQVSTTSTTYNSEIYILNGLTGGRCPAGTGNYASNCLTASAFVGAGGTETINSGQMNALPLNVPLHLFVDSYFSTGANSSGPYTIRIQDATIADSATPPSNDAPFDMNGDGKSDFVIARNTGGGAAGQMTWFTRTSNDTFPAPLNWGIATDKFVPADFDADGKEDFAIWRPGAQGKFFIIRSRSQTVSIEDFGQTGDDPTVVADYTGDGIDDLAVYRDGATAGAQSFWYYRSLGSLTGFTTVAWGQRGDTPAPGYYDSDDRADFVVRRAEGANGRFYIRTAFNFFTSIVFGQANDKVVPGDYDGNGATDIAVVRAGADGILVWDSRGIFSGTTSRNFWGVAATDIITQGDYDGDGRTELSVWRPGSPGVFYQKIPNTGQSNAVSWGQTGDIPVANYNTH
ncbi:MAG: FG-GAP repeat domain-containing protein, partial [Pyrinomonadaceae bacterium]